MNLHGIVRGAIPAVNPDSEITLVQAIGTTSERGIATPVLSRSTGNAQIQPLSSEELQHMDSLNLQGLRRAAYLYGEVSAIVRADRTGGDMIEFDGQSWRVVVSFEQWPDWCKVGLVLQGKVSS